MTFLSSSVFLETVADVYYPGRRRAIETVSVDGRCYRVLVIDRTKVITNAPFMDFVIPLEDGASADRRVGYLPRVAVEAVESERWDAEGLSDRYRPAPYIDWSRFGTWDDYLAHVRARNKTMLKQYRRKARKLERAAGELQFTLHDDRPEILQQVMRWKSRQYQESGHVDVFRARQNVELLQTLNRKNALTTSVLSAGGRPVAIHVGAIYQNRLYGFLPAFDRAHGSCSPGLLLDERLMEASYREGHSVFDFLIGNEPYKWTFATHSQLVAPAGRPPVGQRVWRPVRSFLMRGVRRQERVYALLQSAKRQAVERRLFK